MLERCVIVHHRAGQYRKQLPGTPDADVHQFLRFGFLAIGNQHGHQRGADLGMPRFVSLDAGNQVRERPVAGFCGIRRQTQELHVGEAGFEGEGEHQRDTHRAAGGHHVVEHVARGDDCPFVGAIRLVGPVELTILGAMLVGEEQLNLAMTNLVHHAECRHIAHAWRFAEACHPRLGRRG
ncbi:hypothetical protein D3C78_1266020 [compost metagenome]